MEDLKSNSYDGQDFQSSERFLGKAIPQSSERGFSDSVRDKPTTYRKRDSKRSGLELAKQGKDMKKDVVSRD